MTTTDTVLLIILTTLISVFFLLTIAGIIMILKLLSSVKRVVAKAEDVVDSVESAAEVLKDTQGRLAFLKLVRNIIKLAQRSHKR
jgi:biopolymer transport protein ExbB/TolQ